MRYQIKRQYECPVCEFSTFSHKGLEMHISREATRERKISQGIESDHLRYPYRPSKFVRAPQGSAA